jgi:hypothetical protein
VPSVLYVRLLAAGTGDVGKSETSERQNCSVLRAVTDLEAAFNLIMLKTKNLNSVA